MDSGGGRNTMCLLDRSVFVWSVEQRPSWLFGGWLQEIADEFVGFSEAESFAGPVAELGGDPVQVGFGVHG